MLHNYYNLCHYLSLLSPTPRLRDFFKRRRRMYKGKDNHVWLVCGDRKHEAGLFDFPMDFDIQFRGNHNTVTFHVPEGNPRAYLHRFLQSGNITCWGDNNTFEIGDSKNWISHDFEARLENGARITIGRNAWMQHDCHLFINGYGGAELVCGDDFWLGHYGIVRNHDMHTVIDPVTRKALNPPESVIIGNHEWITHQNAIMKGVRLADGCIIANKAVLTRVFDKPNCLIGGIPAKVIKEGVTWDETAYVDYIAAHPERR